MWLFTSVKYLFSSIVSCVNIHCCKVLARALKLSRLMVHSTSMMLTQRLYNYFCHQDLFHCLWWKQPFLAIEGDDRGWDGWMASLTRWTGVWVNSRSSWWTGRPGVLWFMRSQRVRHYWVTELNWWTSFCPYGGPLSLLSIHVLYQVHFEVWPFPWSL